MGVKNGSICSGFWSCSFAAGNAEDIARDLLIGAAPGAAIGDWRYLAVLSLGAGVGSFWRASVIDRLRSPVLLCRRRGAGPVAVAGTQKALDFGLTPVMAALLGMRTGIGGGMTRDVLLGQIPTVLRADLTPSRRWPARPWW